MPPIFEVENEVLPSDNQAHHALFEAYQKVLFSAGVTLRRAHLHRLLCANSERPQDRDSLDKDNELAPILVRLRNQSRHHFFVQASIVVVADAVLERMAPRSQCLSWSN